MIVFHHHFHYEEPRMSNRQRRRSNYGPLNLLGDILGLLIFNIFWLAWIIVRESRR